MKRILSLKWKIAGYLLAFAAVMIGLIVLFQIVLLEPMYENNKIRTVKQVSSEVVSAIERDQDLEDTLYRTSFGNDVCVRIFSENDDISAGNFGCPLYRMSDVEFLQEISGAQANNNAYLSKRKSLFGGEGGRSINYTRIINSDDKTYVVMVNTSITPFDATTATLTGQLWYIAGAIFIMVVLMVLIMNRRIARPLMKINESAKALSAGSYTVDEGTNKYLEAYELNQTLQKAAEDIQKADKAKRDLIANVSHDLRTPLTMINGYGEMMRDLPGEKTDENIQVIIDESQRLTALVNDLLDLSKLEENRITLEKSVFSMSDMIGREIRKYDVYRMKEGFSIDTQLEDDLFVEADEKRMEQVFNNFMTNAVNYSGDSKRIIVRCLRRGDKVHTEVQDFGEGIEQDKLKDIWDRYYKIDKSHVRFTNGSGIGLAIVRHILELHGCEYGVISEKDVGSTFWFDLPLTESPAEVQPAETR